MIQDNTLFNQNPKETIGKLEGYYFAPFISLAHLFNAPPGWKIHSRSLRQYQLQYVVSGMAKYHIEGKDYWTKHGDLILHRPNEQHSVEMVENQPYVCISIVFHFGVNPFPLDELFKGMHFLGTFLEHQVEKKISQIVTCYCQPGLSNQMLCQGLLMQLFSILSKEIEKNQSSTEIYEKTKAKLVLIRNYIANHYDQNICHSDLEKISGLSKNYITVKFKKIFEMTPFEFLIWIRMEKAKELAIQSNLSIGQIANLVGYSDVHTFGKMFKKKTGISLSQFCSSLIAY